MRVRDYAFIAHLPEDGEWHFDGLDVDGKEMPVAMLGHSRRARRSRQLAIGNDLPNAMGGHAAESG